MTSGTSPGKPARMAGQVTAVAAGAVTNRIEKRRPARPEGWMPLSPREACRALLHERHRALDEIVAAGHLLLDFGLLLELLVRDDAVDQAPLQRLRRWQTLAEHRQLARARHADARRQEQRGAAVRHEADVDEREQEVGARGGHDQVAAQRQR